MNNKDRNSRLTPSCALCRVTRDHLTMCEGGHVCDDCAERIRDGGDNATRAAKMQQRAMRGQAAALRAKSVGVSVEMLDEYRVAAAELLVQESLAVPLPERGAGGEVVPHHDLELRDTLATPGVAALDASAHRLDLITAMGTDIAAMALDTADSMSATNSVERMYSHQLALLHSLAMRMVSKGSLEDDPVTANRTMNLGLRAMEAFQRGAINLNRLRGGGQQVVRVEHVHVAPGGQAIVGHVQTGEIKK